jgi:tRNA 2-thiouridine synthesizing protein B
MLFVLRNSPRKVDLVNLKRQLQQSDDLLLIQDAVLAGLQGNAFLAKLQESRATVSVLLEDVEARGLIDQIDGTIKLINYGGFVELTEKHQQQVLW